MRTVKRPLLVAAVALLGLAFAHADESRIVIVGPGILRHFAESTVLPEYPAISFRARHTGVAVIEVTVSMTGRVSDTKILQAPDRQIASSVETALKGWTFRPLLLSGKPITMKSRLIFYFRVANRKAVVIDAIDAASATAPAQQNTSSSRTAGAKR